MDELYGRMVTYWLTFHLDIEPHQLRVLDLLGAIQLQDL